MQKNSNHLEIEVKFFITQTDEIHHHIMDLGAISLPRTFETNIRFENPDESLKNGGKLLRLRQDGSCQLTYKSRPPQADPDCKVFQELEVEIGNFQIMWKILNALGFKAVQHYEKWRGTYTWKDVVFCLDTLPFGTFLEIEGSKTGIVEAAQKLHLNWKNRILSNYLSIFEQLKKKFDLPFNDVTFKNFENYVVDITPILPLLEAGE